MKDEKKKDLDEFHICYTCRCWLNTTSTKIENHEMLAGVCSNEKSVFYNLTMQNNCFCKAWCAIVSNNNNNKGTEQMKDEKKTTVQINFATPEVTIQDIIDAGDALVAQLYTKGCELTDVEQSVRMLSAQLSMRIRAEGKVTEGLVASAIDADADIGTLRVKADKLKYAVTCLRQEIENMHDTRKMFTAWMESQKAAGLIS